MNGDPILRPGGATEFKKHFYAYTHPIATTFLWLAAQS